MADYKCARCAADPQPSNYDSPRKCAFLADGSFNKENWHCATLNWLVGVDHETLYGEDESMDVINPHGYDDGWIAFVRYKRHGRVEAAVLITKHGGHPLTLAVAEERIRKRSWLRT